MASPKGLMDPWGSYDYTAMMMRQLAREISYQVKTQVEAALRPSQRFDPYYPTPRFPYNSFAMDYAMLDIPKPEPPPPPMEAPQQTLTAITGFRKWETDQARRLLVTQSRFIWEPYQQSTAICSKSIQTTYTTPSPCKKEKCNCGFYGWAALDKLSKPYYDDTKQHLTPEIYGEVSLWGEVYEHEKGYRGQFAYPKCFYNLGQEWLPEIAARYGVPIKENPWKSASQSA